MTAVTSNRRDTKWLLDVDESTRTGHARPIHFLRRLTHEARHEDDLVGLLAQRHPQTRFLSGLSQTHNAEVSAAADLIKADTAKAALSSKEASKRAKPTESAYVTSLKLLEANRMQGERRKRRAEGAYQTAVEQHQAAVVLEQKHVAVRETVYSEHLVGWEDARWVGAVHEFVVTAEEKQRCEDTRAFESWRLNELQTFSRKVEETLREELESQGVCVLVGLVAGLSKNDHFITSYHRVTHGEETAREAIERDAAQLGRLLHAEFVYKRVLL